MTLECPMCCYVAKSQHTFIKHCLARHRHDGNFIGKCSFERCLYQTKSWNAFKIHHKRRHGVSYEKIRMLPDTLNIEDSSTDDESILNPQEQEIVHAGPEEVAQKKSLVMRLAKYYLTLEGDHKLTKKSIDNIADTTREIATLVIEDCLDKFCEFLRQIGHDPHDIVNEITDMNRQMNSNVMASCDMFLTNYNREAVYDNLCHLVRPREVVMGYRYVKRKNQTKRVPVTAYYVPLIQQLQALLQLPEIGKYVMQGNTRQDNSPWMTDVSDGHYLKTHRLTVAGEPFIQLGISFDDIEIQNPLRSSQRFKLSMFYFSILNIPVQFRSRLKTIFLLGIARAKDLKKFGMEKFLHDFTTSLNTLSTEGISCRIDGTDTLIRGELIFAVCDGPASSALGGWKDGVFFAQKPCRRCNASKTDMKTKFRSKDFTQRTMEEYLRQCDRLEDTTLKKKDIAFFSKLYGVNKRSTLCQIDHFPVTDNLLFDNMHCLSEGINCHLLALFLYHSIIELDLFTLDWLNREIDEFPFTQRDRAHKPEPITRQMLVVDTYIKQKAVAMNTLIFILPQILGPVFMDTNSDHYKHYIKLVQINQLCFTTISTLDSAFELECLVASFAADWSVLYPMSNFRPKLHFLIHMPNQIREFGPLHAVSCLRYESKHFFFKLLTNIRNYRNLPYSFSNKHQLYLCNQMMDIYGNYSPHFLYAGDTVGDGNEIKITDRSPELFSLLRNSLGPKEYYVMYEVDFVEVYGIKYCNGHVLVLDSDEEGFPIFGIIEHVFVTNTTALCVVGKLATICYRWEFHSYIVENTLERQLVSIKKLRNPFPCQVYVLEDMKLIMNRNGHLSEMVWFKITTPGRSPFAVSDPTSLEQTIERAKKKFELKMETETLHVYMEDGCELCSDEELTNPEIVNGKLLIVAENFEKYKHAGKEEAGEIPSRRVSPRKRNLAGTSVQDEINETGTKKKLHLSDCTDYNIKEPVDTLIPVEVDKSSSIVELEIPEFSPYVRTSLRDGDDSELVANLMMEQMTNFYETKGKGMLEGKKQFKRLGEMLIRRYPTLKRDGTTPWQYWMSKLSGRLRARRWKGKKGMDNNTEAREASVVKVAGEVFVKEDLTMPPDAESNRTSASKISIAARKADKGDFLKMKEEMQKEMEKKKLNRSKIKMLMRDTFQNRREEISEWDREEEAMMSKVLKEWPCFRHGDFIFEEMKCMMSTKGEKKMDNVVNSAKKFFKAMEKVLETKGKIRTEEVFQKMTKKIFEETGFKTGGAEKRSQNPVKIHVDMGPHEMEAAVSSQKDSTPVLHVFLDKKGHFDIAQVAGDNEVIDLEAYDLERVLILFVGVYYVFSIGYNRQVAQVMGFLQQGVLLEPFEGTKTNGFKDLMKIFDEALQSVKDSSQFKKYA